MSDELNKDSSFVFEDNLYQKDATITIEKGMKFAKVLSAFSGLESQDKNFGE